MLVSGPRAHLCSRLRPLAALLLLLAIPRALEAQLTYRGLRPGMTHAAIVGTLKPAAQTLTCQRNEAAVNVCTAVNALIRGVLLKVEWHETPSGAVYSIEATRSLPAPVTENASTPIDTATAYAEALIVQWGTPIHSTGYTAVPEYVWKSGRWRASNSIEGDTYTGTGQNALFVVRLYDWPVFEEMEARSETAARRARTRGVEP